MGDSSPRYSGPWSEEEVAEFLSRAAIPIRVAANTPGGFPVIVSLWFLHEGDELLAAIHRDSRLAKRLGEDSRCGFEIAVNDPPYRGVRGQGEARLERDGARELLERLLVRYLDSTDSSLGRFLLGRADEELVVRLQPSWIASWDYSDRMQDAVD
jgi:hypothetical protein